MKNILLLTLSIFIFSCGQPITHEEEQRLQKSIAELNQLSIKSTDEYHDISRSVEYKRSESQSLDQSIADKKTELGILKSGKQPQYILKLHFQEHKMELSMDRISFDFEIPVDERFYKESEIGEKLGKGSRSFSIGHSGDIKVVDKRITY